jgi:hypothetical protein
MPRGLEGQAKTNTICEVHRKMYRILMQNKEQNKALIEFLKEAFIMAKKMSNKLLQYNRSLGYEWYQAHRVDGGKIDENELV